MPDGLTAHPTPPTHHLPAPRPARAAAWVVPAQVAAIVVVFAVVGVAAGWLWWKVWDQPSGVVSQGQWFTSEAGLRDDFQGVAWYVTICVVAGLVLGLLCAWLFHRSELATLAAVVVGSVIAAYLVLRVGTHFSPADPQELAKHAKDGTKLKGDLQVGSWPPRGAFPFGALVGLALVYAFSMGRTPDDVRGDDPHWPYPPPPPPQR